MRLDYAIVFVEDMSRSVTFYRDALGLLLRFETPDWTEFETGSATLALHRASAPGTSDSHAPAAGRASPGFSVPDLAAFHAGLIANGVRCVQEPRETFAVRIATYLDPDGLAIAVSERRRG